MVLWVKEQKVTCGLITYLEWQAMYELPLSLGVLHAIKDRKDIAYLTNTAILEIKGESDDNTCGFYHKETMQHVGPGRLCDDNTWIIKQTIDDKYSSPLLEDLLDETTTREVLLVFFKRFRNCISDAGLAMEPEANFDKE